MKTLLFLKNSALFFAAIFFFTAVARAQTPAEVIVDNDDANVTRAGTWTKSTTGTCYGGSWRNDGNVTADKGPGKYATFTPTLPASGQYQVYAWWPMASNRATNVPHDIFHAGTTDTVTVDQKSNGDGWCLLGTYTFSADGAEYVKIRTDSTNGYVAIDAIKFVQVLAPQARLELDNTPSTETSGTSKIPGPGVTVTGAWAGKTTSTGYVGINYWTDNGTGKGSKSVTYTPIFTATGLYQVQTIWPSYNSAFSTNTPIDVCHSGATTTVTVDQQKNGQMWYTLGFFEFSGDGNEYVKIKNDGTADSSHVVADAVRFVKYAPLTALDNTAISDTDSTSKVSGPGVTANGNWTASVSSSGFQGANYWHDGTKSASKWVAYSPVLPESGRYMVQMWWPKGSSNFASAAPIDICHSGTTNTVTVDQTKNGQMWWTLGIHDFDASGNEYVKIRTDDNGAVSTDGNVVADAVRFVKYEPLTYLDNTAITDAETTSKVPGPGVTANGNWTASVSTSGFQGANYWNDGTKSASKWVMYSPMLPEPGRYMVQMSWPKGSELFSETTPVDVCHSGTTSTVTVDQTKDGSTWWTIGIHDFDASGNEYVKIRTDDGAGGTVAGAVVADAVRFVKFEPLTTLDNTAEDDTDAASKVVGPGITTQGNWTASTSRTGFKGANYWTDGNTGGSGSSTVAKSVTYTPVLPAAGRYMVQMWWPRYATNFATNTPVDIKHNGVTETFSVNQRTGGEMWYTVGVFDFAGTGNEYLKIRNEGADYYVIADAVRFVSVDEQEPFVMSFEKVATNQSSSCRRAFGAGVYDEVSNQTYICWNGPGMSVYVRAYDHATGTWGAATEICHLAYTSTYDYHDYPVLTRAPDGRLVVYFCQHANKLYQLKAPSPHSIAGTWTKTEIGTDLNAYPMPVVVGADIYLFYSKNNDSSWPYRQYRYIKSSDNGDTWTAPATLIDSEKADPQKFDEVYGWGFEYNENTKRIGLTWTMAGSVSHNAAHKGLYFAWFDTADNTMKTVSGTSLGGTVTHAELAQCLVNGAVGDPGDTTKGHHYPFTSPMPSFDNISGQPVIAYGFYDSITGRESIRSTRWNGTAWVDSIIQQNVKSFSDIRKNGIGELIALYHYSGNILMKSSQDGGATWEQVSAAAVPFSDGCDKVAELIFLDNIKAPLTAFLGLGFEDTSKPGGYNYDGIFPVYMVKADIADSPAAFLVHPDAGESVIGGTQLVLTVAASGKPTPTYQWQVKEGASASWRNLTAADTNFTGADTDTLTILAVSAAIDGWEFRAVANNGGAPVYSNATTIVLSQLPAFDTSSVSEQAAVAGGTLDLVASVSSPTAVILNWQVNDGTGWRNLTAADTNFAGIGTNALSILSVTAAMNNWQIRLLATNELGDSHTNATTLKVMAADLAAPVALVFDTNGNIYVADADNHSIYKIDSSKKVNTLAGSATAGLVDDIGTSARFSAPQGVAIHPTLGTLLVADTANAAIRSVTATGTTTTFLGTIASMAAPVGIAFDTAGDMYISDAQKHVIHVLRSGSLKVYAGASGTADFIDDSTTGAAARFNTPTGIAFGKDGNLYVADTGNNAIRIIMPIDTTNFAVTTLAGTAAGINAPRGLVVSGTGADMRVYLANTGGNNICEVDPATGTVTALAGHETGVAGFKDGIGAEAWFDHPEGIAIGNDHNLYVADTDNAVIRKIAFNSSDEAVVSTQLFSTGSSFAPPPVPPDPGQTYADGRRPGGGAPTYWFFIMTGLLFACRFGRGFKKR